MRKHKLNLRSSFILLAETDDEVGSNRSARKLTQQKPSVGNVS